jgi:outer membrane protein assembly factor BamB
MFALAIKAAAPAADVSAWPTWRGTSGTGVAVGAQPPIKWSDAQNIRWKTKIPGAGFSTPIIWQNRIFLLTAIETQEESTASTASSATPPPPRAEQSGPPDRKGGPRGGKKGGGFGAGPKPTKVHEFVVVALDRSTGKIAWQKTARREVPHEGHHPSHGYASASPVTDGGRLYVSFGSRGFYCYDLNGALLWEKDLGDMTVKGGFGEGASPALAGGLLIINWDHEGQSFIVALDK